MRKVTVGFMALIVAIAFAGVAYAENAEQAVAGNAENGASLWKSKKCKNCHNMSSKKKVGPGLAGVTSRRTGSWLRKWLIDPQKTWEENDAETQELKKWKKGVKNKKKTQMRISSLSESDIADVIAYIKANGG